MKSIQEADEYSHPLIHKPNKNKNCCTCTNIYFTILLLLQIASVVYLILLSEIANNLHMYGTNASKVDDYVKKIETIIDYVCDHEPIC
jgi:hypothetical protein